MRLPLTKFVTCVFVRFSCAASNGEIDVIYKEAKEALTAISKFGIKAIFF
jgi:hypothetical protein